MLLGWNGICERLCHHLASSNLKASKSGGFDSQTDLWWKSIGKLGEKMAAGKFLEMYDLQRAAIE
jgi:hypothetical protein